MCSPRSPAPRPHQPRPVRAPHAPAGSCAARAAACSLRAGSAQREAPLPRARSPAPRSGPYVTDFEFPDRGTREVGRRLCPTLSLLGLVSRGLPSASGLSEVSVRLRFRLAPFLYSLCASPLVSAGPRFFRPCPLPFPVSFLPLTDTLWQTPPLWGRTVLTSNKLEAGLVPTEPSPSLPQKGGGEDSPGRSGGGGYC